MITAKHQLQTLILKQFTTLKERIMLIHLMLQSMFCNSEFIVIDQYNDIPAYGQQDSLWNWYHITMAENCRNTIMYLNKAREYYDKIFLTTAGRKPHLRWWMDIHAQYLHSLQKHILLLILTVIFFFFLGVCVCVLQYDSSEWPVHTLELCYEFLSNCKLVDVML